MGWHCQWKMEWTSCRIDKPWDRHCVDINKNQLWPSVCYRFFGTLFGNRNHHISCQKDWNHFSHSLFRAFRHHQLGHGSSGCHSSCGRLYLSLWMAFTSRIWYEGNLQGVWKKCINQSKYFLQRCSALHRGAFCQFLFRFIHYCHKSTGKETCKTHICALVISEGLV